MSGENGGSSISNKNLIELGYNKEGMIVMIMNGMMDDKPFKAVSQLAIPQALKLADDLRMTVITMTAERERK